MGTIQRDCWKCEVCGHEWLKQDAVVPTHCASSKCRSRKWNVSVMVEVAREVLQKAGAVFVETVQVDDVDITAEFKRERTVDYDEEFAQ